MPEQIVVKSSAIFIADSHENENRENFWHFLCALKSGEIKTPQLFLMGDMFDFLAGECEFFVKFYERYVRAIDELGEEMEIYYFEGITILTSRLCLKTSKSIRSALSRLNLPRSATKACLSRMEIYFCLLFQNTL